MSFLQGRQFHRCNSTLSTDSSRQLGSILELRNRLKQEGHLRRCSPSDVHLVQSADWWLNAFLLAYDYDIDVAYAVVLECLKWRHNFDVEHLSMLALKPLLDRKHMYVHGYDVERNSIIWMNLREHSPGEKPCQLFAYWIERHFVETHGSPLTLLIDATGSSLMNMDFDFFKFVFHCLKFYYPNTVHDMLIFDSPAILNASWKVMRSWLDAAHPQMNLVDKVSVKQYIHSVYLPQHMGGEDPFVFTMEELARCIPSRNSPDSLPMESDMDEQVRPDLDCFPVKRSVKFDDDEEAVRRTPLTVTNTRRSSSRGPGKRGSSRSGMPSNLRPVAEKRVHAPEGDWVRNAFIAISPREELFLQRLEGDLDFVDIVALRNTGENNVMFKIKTTSPEKFRVRPSSGVVSAGSTESIRVYLQNEYRHSAGREKFLLMAMETESTAVEQFSELWKASPSEKRVEQKLRCRVNLPNDGDDSPTSTVKVERRSTRNGELPNSQLDTLRLDVSQLSHSVRLLTLLVAVLFLFQFYLFITSRTSSSLTSTAGDPAVEQPSSEL